MELRLVKNKKLRREATKNEWFGNMKVKYIQKRGECKVGENEGETTKTRGLKQQKKRKKVERILKIEGPQ